jgi:hypothetical protein
LSVGTGLPDGLFSNQKYQFGYIFEGLGMENVGIFMIIWKYLVNFMVVWYSLWLFGIYIFSVLVCLDRAKSGNPASELG